MGPRERGVGEKMSETRLLWTDEDIETFLLRTVGGEKISTPMDAVKYARAAVSVIVGELNVEIAALTKRVGELGTEKLSLQSHITSMYEARERDEAYIEELQERLQDYL